MMHRLSKASQRDICNCWLSLPGHSAPGPRIGQSEPAMPKSSLPASRVRMLFPLQLELRRANFQLSM